jgi:hypothetical protein
MVQESDTAASIFNEKGTEGGGIIIKNNNKAMKEQRNWKKNNTKDTWF